MSAPPAHAPRVAPHPEIGRTDAPRADIVTASDLVRRFGLWQERAARAPVYVMFRGRPRLVLTTIEVMEALVAPHVLDRDVQTPDAVALLDLIRDMVVIADADLCVAASSRTARHYFGTGVGIGLSIETLVPVAARDMLLRAVRHVIAAGISQTVDVPSPRRIGGLLTMTIEPHHRGAALRIEDVSPTAN